LHGLRLRSVLAREAVFKAAPFPSDLAPHTQDLLSEAIVKFLAAHAAHEAFLVELAATYPPPAFGCWVARDFNGAITQGVEPSGPLSPLGPHGPQRMFGLHPSKAAFIAAIAPSLERVAEAGGAYRVTLHAPKARSWKVYASIEVFRRMGAGEAAATVVLDLSSRVAGHGIALSTGLSWPLFAGAGRLAYLVDLPLTDPKSVYTPVAAVLRLNEHCFTSGSGSLPMPDVDRALAFGQPGDEATLALAMTAMEALFWSTGAHDRPARLPRNQR
jgi:hypothetical protein